MPTIAEQLKDNAQRFANLRQRVHDAIERDLEVDGHCKRYEGNMAIECPDYFEASDDDRDGWAIVLDLYLIAPNGRHHTWRGSTLDEALTKAEDEIGAWLDEHESWLAEATSKSFAEDDE